MKREFDIGDLVILVDIYSMCLEYDMERYVKAADWHEEMCVIVAKRPENGGHAYRVLRTNGRVEYTNALFLFEPTEYFHSTYEQLYNIAMKERSMNEKLRWRKYSKTEDVKDNRQTSLN